VTTGPIEDKRLEILHQHFKDSVEVANGFRTSRDRHFYAILAVLAFVLYDTYAPQESGRVVEAYLKKQLELSTLPSLTYLGTLIWFLLLGIVLRYGQATVNLERQYAYNHRLEARIDEMLGGDDVFTREGKAYLKDYPWFGTWAHCLYTVVFPAALAAIVCVRILNRLQAAPAIQWVTIFDVLIGAGILVTIALAFAVIHAPAINEWLAARRARRARPAGGKATRVTTNNDG
jgi:hypothetical protein